ncbi:sugar transferase [Methylobacterium currus]|uniref:sugar transferase n=1 Tax=Methylobacterium currus TaxID=2051553 RepID=UPI001E32E2BA|nr:sugar transferase [Methylobacterium currus]UHC16687.1 sugar transferase [Methylobacterium currus]
MQSRYIDAIGASCFPKQKTGSFAGTVNTAGARNQMQRAGKRGLDICVALVAILLLMPLIGVLCMIIWMGDGGMPIYRHRRIGRNGRAFHCLKLRSMVIDGDQVLERHLADNPESRDEWNRTRKLTRDPRITRVGHFLRKSSLDELPQLWNVLVGEMSLVGPRPIVEAEIAHYGDRFAICFSMTPGITGLWQVSGRSDCKYSERVTFDVNYTNNWWLGRDMAILLKTVPAVLAQRGSR